MADQIKKDNVTSYRPRRRIFNTGLIIFLIILFYTMYFVVQYMTQDHISVYEVEQGAIVRDSVYTGIAIREEEVVTASNAQTAVISYYAADGQKVGTSTLIYSLSANESVTDLIASESADAQYFSDDDISELQRMLIEYTATYSDLDFADLYDVSTTVGNSLMESLNTSALAYLQETSSDDDISLYYAASPGIIAFYTDGYEEVTADEVTREMIEAQSSERVSLSNGDSVSSGDAVYKLTNDENWQVVISVSESMADELEEAGSVEVEFAKDGRSAWASVTTRRDGEDYLAVLSFTNSMSRYSDDRFLSVTLNLDDVSGLKIPNSAITQKEFFLIPKDFVSYDDTENTWSLLILEDDGTVTEISPEVYAETDEDYYITDDALSAGTVITDADGNTDTLYETAVLQGCYNINKGYTVFKQIEVLYESENYTIISDDTDYGLAQFDHIALNADTVYEGEIVN